MLFFRKKFYEKKVLDVNVVLRYTQENMKINPVRNPPYIRHLGKQV